MNTLCIRHVAAAVAAVALSSPAAAQLLLDDFSAPAGGWARAASGAPGSPGATVYVCEAGLPVPGGARDTYHAIYGNPLASVAAVGIGDGRMSVAQGAGLTAETLLLYGAFSRVGCDPRVGGPGMALDLSAYKSLRLFFTGAEDGLNLNVTYYTSAPLNPAAPLYYASNGINIGPASSGAALEAALQVGNNPAFNWRQVDGIVIIINRSGPTPATAYTLGKVTLSKLAP